MERVKILSFVKYNLLAVNINFKYKFLSKWFINGRLTSYGQTDIGTLEFAPNFNSVYAIQ
jgi:DNA polymerase III alpha subunit (gram-positive type)